MGSPYIGRNNKSNTLFCQKNLSFFRPHFALALLTWSNLERSGSSSKLLKFCYWNYWKSDCQKPLYCTDQPQNWTKFTVIIIKEPMETQSKQLSCWEKSFSLTYSKT